jgi:plastocyanin
MRPPVVILAVATTLLAAGCGSGGGGSSSTTAPAPAAASNGGAASGAVTKVSMKNIQFDPRTITVKKGTAVEWVNDDSVSHDVTKTSGPGPDFSSGSGNLAGGDTYKVAFNAAGTIKYQCTIHPGMTGTVVVR